MSKSVRSRKGLSSLQVDKESLDTLKKLGTKDETYSSIIKRMNKNPYNLDEGLIGQLNMISGKFGLDRKTLITFGVVFVIFLASSGAIQQLQSVAIKTNKPMLVVFTELLKKFGI
jgi:hypothetical protein